MKALLQLRQYWIADFHLRPIATEGEDQPEADEDVLPSVDVNVFQSEEEPGQYAVRVNVKLLPETARAARLPYDFDLTLLGIFGFAEGTPLEVQQQMIHVNGSQILYGLARGLVADVTTHGPRGRYILPSVNLIQLLAEDTVPAAAETPAN